jgi:hypothetical protein
MRTRFRAILLLILTLALTSIGAAAQRSATPSPLKLANHAPANSILYVSTRLDAGFIETLDSVLFRLSSAMGFPTRNGLTNNLNSVGLRPWLGDSGALFMQPLPDLNINSDAYTGLLVEVADRAAAEIYLTNLYGEPTQDRETGDSLFVAFGLTTYRLTDRLLIVAGDKVDAPLSLLREGIPTDGLGSSPLFIDAVTALPEQDAPYPIIGYFNLRTLIGQGLGEELKRMLPPSIDVTKLAEFYGQMAIGFHQLGGQVMVMDMAWQHGSSLPFPGLEDINIYVSQPLSLDFLRHVPADAQFVVQGINLWDSIQTAARVGSRVTHFLRDDPTFISSTGASGMMMSANPFFSIFGSQVVTGIAELTLRGALDLEPAQLSDALNGNAALALRVTPQLGRTTTPAHLIEAGAWLESTGTGARDLLSGASALIDQFGVTLTPSPDGFAFTLPGGQMSSGQPALTLPTEYRWYADDSLTYIGAEALTLENKQTLVAVPRITDRLSSILPYVLSESDTFAWIDMASIAALVAPQDRMTGQVLSEFDGWFISGRQTRTLNRYRLALVLTR